MPPKSNRQSQCFNAIKSRWSTESDASSDDSNFSMETSDEDEADTKLNFRDTIQICDIADMFEFCKNQCNIRYLSVLIYLILRRFNISYEETHRFLKTIGGLTADVTHKWSNVFMNGNFDEFLIDGRGGKRGDSFYDVYPELEVDAKAFAVLQCEQKAPSFTVYDLAQFIDKEYYEVNKINKVNSDLVRSVGSCRLDLRNWNARFENNTNRPYFEGHESSDVIAHREQFIHYLLTNEDKYYTVSSDENPVWQTPKSLVPTILICHNESTFRSGDVRAKLWLVDTSAPFFNKGGGRRVMISHFLVHHPSGPFFQLNEKEWTNAVQRFPDLLEDTDLRYENYSATITAHLGADPYFDNSIILLQFERLFKLLKFKEEYQKHNIEILVDNARTHSAKPFSINDFGKRSGTRCPVASIEYIDEVNNTKTLDCFFQSGLQKGQSKGLLAIALELGFKVSTNCKLEELKILLSCHKAFKNVSL
ncbi:unnamed protein product [Rotaria socialis]